MLCDICHKNIATVHLTEIVNENVMELHLCQECARLKTEGLKYQLNLSDFLTGLVEKYEPQEKKSLTCPLCGLTFYEFKKKGKMGCSRCYETFKAQLLPLFRKIHGSVHHVGKSPRRVKDNMHIKRKMKELKKRLERAVTLEEYEEAAQIRDEIKALEAKNEK